MSTTSLVLRQAISGGGGIHSCPQMRIAGLDQVPSRNSSPLFGNVTRLNRDAYIDCAKEYWSFWRQCAPWRELLDPPPYSLPPWSPWSSAGVDGVAKLLPHTHTNRIRRKLERGAKLNLTAAIRTRGARAIVLLEEVNNTLYIYYLIYRSSIKTTSRVYSLVVERR